jgi:hypothetical protein
MEHLKEAFRRLDPALPLDGHLLQEYYVERPGDPVGKLSRILDLSETPQHILLVGQRGVGKTTELHRLGSSLSASRFTVLHNLDHESISNANQGIRGLAEALERAATARHLPLTRSTGTRAEWERLTEAVERIRQSGFRPVLLVDGLEKRQGRKLEPVARLVTELRRIECSIVLIVPLSFVLLPEYSAEMAEWDRVVTLPAISVRHRDGRPDEAGLELLETVISRRDPSRIFSQEARQSVVNLSAGIHRTLLTLAQDACLNAMTRPSHCVDLSALKSAADERGLEMNGFLTPQYLGMLASIRDTKLIRNFADVLPLLERNSIIAYQNSSPWYDVNPLVSPSLAAFVGSGGTSS